jgi:hypothetical protein
MTQLSFLIACEESGAVRDAIIQRGHMAVSCDLLPSSATANRHLHIMGDVVPLLGMGWDGMICFPPCTYLSSSGLHWNKRPGNVRYGGTQTEEALDFVRLLLGAPIEHIALENPQGCIGTRIRPADQFVQPYEFGDDASKKTGLWLKNLPPLEIDPAKRCPGRIVEWPRGSGRMVERWDNQTDSGQNKLPPTDDRSVLRSKTYPGIAEAMADRWIAHILAQRYRYRRAA